MQARWVQEDKLFTVQMYCLNGEQIEFNINRRLLNFLVTAGEVTLYFYKGNGDNCVNKCNFDDIKISATLGKFIAPVNIQAEPEPQTLSIKKGERWLSLGGWVDERDYLKIINIQSSKEEIDTTVKNTCQFCEKELPLGKSTPDDTIVCNHCDKVLKTKECQKCRYDAVPQNALICPKCGESPDITASDVINEGVKVCINCDVQNVSADTMICPECGTNPDVRLIAKQCKSCDRENVAIAKFCSNCGQNNFQNIY